MEKHNNRRFYSLNDFFKDEFKDKIFKVSLDGGFTCPNRDGKVAHGGCIFCSDAGSGEFAGNRRKSITEQIDEQLEFLKDKVKDKKVIAYFQNFTNTYGDVEYLREIYYEALNHPKVLGLAIGTRPDCIEDDTLELLKEINEKHFFWIELGLQTIDDKVAKIINRGYPLSTYIETSKKLKDSGIKFVTHMIVGLPTEEREDILNTAKCIVQSGAWGIKIHSLHIIKGTPLERLYNDKKFKVFTLDEYVDIVVTILKLLPDKMVVHRVTGDGKKDEVVEPKWSLNKRKVLNEIEKELKKRENI
ncbi:TIGR01212 family radical SAM protein [Cetobacterium somerae]|uniref:TIGR01212 family radical SAM protein n=2 Tax=Fusobacteriaceae TaxID=203492 RepID=UPI001F060297|nr:MULTISPECIES: TIGR01212 family radical SAM protein [Cetobacterium]MCX3065918.1 TIGR01212 family radical SAM protein [Cetobacterium somerae]UPO98062.1 TIGR01212 family radical SAM protein [Cetobacterium somerae]